MDVHHCSNILLMLEEGLTDKDGYYRATQMSILLSKHFCNNVD